MAINNLQFDITHDCNKMCKKCDHFVGYSNYSGLSKDDYRYIVACIENPDMEEIIGINGGEPLMHPDFEWFIREIKKDFRLAKIEVVTNGKLLPNIDRNILRIIHITITHYPGWNDDVISEFSNKPIVLIDQHLSHNEMWDPFYNPNLNEKEAKKLRAKCPRYDIRVTGRNLYGCCMAEPIERYFDTESVHIEFDKNWKEDHKKLPTWKACQHCYKVKYVY